MSKMKPQKYSELAQEHHRKARSRIYGEERTASRHRRGATVVDPIDVRYWFEQL